jgi:hypothetical protein
MLSASTISDSWRATGEIYRLDPYAYRLRMTVLCYEANNINGNSSDKIKNFPISKTGGGL